MKIYLSDIVLATANAMRGEYSKRELLSESRARNLVIWRYASMRVARRLTGRSTLMIGMVYGRDHTTVIHGLRTKHHTRAHEVAIVIALRAVRAERHKRRAALKADMAEAAS
jgi:chromosomal replication initiation ATPase DnaA